MAFGAYFEKDIKTEFFLIFETNITIIEKEKSFFVSSWRKVFCSSQPSVYFITLTLGKEQFDDIASKSSGLTHKTVKWS